MKFYSVLRSCARWLLPYNIYKFGARIASADTITLYGSQRGRELLQILAPNNKLRNIHATKRCFILGTGPSIAQQNLLLLKNEHCIYLSRFYNHEQYRDLQPKYHFFSGSVHHELPYDVCLTWHKEIEQKIPTSVTLLMNVSEYKLIQEHKLYQQHKIHYFSFTKPIDEIFQRGIDATKYLSGGHSVVIMAIQLAVFMGFKEIYLLGFDQNEKSAFSHFYNNDKDYIGAWATANALDQDTAFEREVFANAFFIKQLYMLKNYTDAHNIIVENATPGSRLLVFPKVSYESLWKPL